MGCCNLVESKHDQEVYQQFILEFLGTFPLTQHSGKHCLQQHFSSVQPFSIRRQSTLTSIYSMGNCLNSSENRYNESLELLYNIANPNSNQTVKEKKLTNIIEGRKETSRSNTTRTRDELNSESPFTEGNKIETKKNVSIGSIYYSITPDYNTLYDSIIKGKPKSSYILFILGFCKDVPKLKAELFIQVFENAGLTLTIFNFRYVIQIYFLMQLDFSFQLYDCLYSNKSKMFLEEVNVEFGIKLNPDAMNQWYDYNFQLKKQRMSLSSKLSKLFSHILMFIVSYKVEPSNFEQYKYQILEIYDASKSSQKLEEVDCAHKEFSIDDIGCLLLFEPSIFNSKELRLRIANLSEEVLVTHVI